MQRFELAISQGNYEFTSLSNILQETMRYFFDIFSNTFTCLNLQKCENTFIASEHQLRRQSVIAQKQL